MKTACVVVLAALFAHALSQAISSPYVGVTKSVYNGSQAACTAKSCGDGYYAAKSRCAKEYPGSRICTADDIAIIAQSPDTLFVILGKGDARYVDLSFADAYEPGTTNVIPLNDCAGYTTDSSDQYSRCLREILGGPVLPTICRCHELLSFICCQ